MEYSKIVSTEMIKPSSPTPNHLRTYNLCVLDQLIPVPYAPIVFFYRNLDHDHDHKLLVLKKSLSETLTRFYPLAGSIKDEFCVDCDDVGARFTVVEIDRDLSEFLEQPDLNIISRFLIDYGQPNGDGSCAVTSIQASVFKSGGLAIGLCMSHRVVDGTSMVTFLKSWAATAAGASVETLVHPDFSAASLFPAVDLTLKQASIAMWGALFRKGQFVTKRFVFDPPAIRKLTKLATHSTGSGAGASRVEAVTGFIWKRAIAASEKRFGYRKPHLLTHTVNLRKRASPNLSENTIGNLLWMSRTNYAAENEIPALPALAEEVRKSILKLDADFMKKLVTGEGLAVMQEQMKEVERLGYAGTNFHGFSSWCKLGFYEIDFGWGKPIWVSGNDLGGPSFINVIILMDCRNGDGMEAWMTLDRPEMDAFENDEEFRALASLNPNPIKD